MSDTDLRRAERALTANPTSRDLRLAYARAWERAGRPLRRDPRRDPRPGDVVGGRLVVARNETRDELAWESADDPHRLWPVQVEGGLHADTAVRLPTDDGWRTGRVGTWVALASWRSWCRRSRSWLDDGAPAVRWAEPHDWGAWHLEPQHVPGAAACACRRRREALRLRMEQHARELA